MTQGAHSDKAAGQLHEPAHTGGVEIVDTPGKPDDGFGRGLPGKPY